MKQHTKLLFIACLLSLAVTSCDFLEVEPEEQISINEQLGTKEGVIQALLGAYSSLTTTMFSEAIMVYPEINAGNIAFAPNVNNKLVEVPTFIMDAYNFDDIAMESNLETFYANTYKLINEATVLLTAIEDLPNTTTDEKDQLKAECYALRAYAFFRLAKVYMQPHGFTTDNQHLGLVIYETPLIIGEDFPSRSTAQETFDFIKRDLDRALDLQRGVVFSTLDSSLFFRENAVRAVYADFALWVSDWDAAFTHANFLIQNSGIGLVSGTESYVQDMIGSTESTEALLSFSKRISFDDGASALDISNIYGFSDENNYKRYTASADLRDLYEPSDVRASEFYQIEHLDTQVNGAIESKPYYFTAKSQDVKSAVAYRLTEMLLIRAEANARRGNLENARTDLNQIRVRAAASEVLTTDNLLQIIWDERRRELAFEGKAFYDFKRTQRDIVRDQDCIADQCDLPFPSPEFVLPIPMSTIDVNPNIQQNEGY